MLLVGKKIKEFISRNVLRFVIHHPSSPRHPGARPRRSHRWCGSNRACRILPQQAKEGMLRGRATTTHAEAGSSVRGRERWRGAMGIPAVSLVVAGTQ
jgi:hypothetical protein